MPQYFKFYVDGEYQFGIKLKSKRCKGRTTQGGVCRRHSVIGTPYCRQHLKSQMHLEIKESTLPGAGIGLFAYKPENAGIAPVFAPNPTAEQRNQYGTLTRVCKFDGDYITKAELDRRYGDYTAPYAFQPSENSPVIDPAGHRSIGSLINHRPNRPRVGIPANTKWTVNFRKNPIDVNIDATRPIMHGEEIFLSYGPKYRLNEEGVDYETSTRKYIYL